MTVFGKLLTVTTVLLLPRRALASPYVISDDRIRSLDITPVLGRGYSVATNSFQSTCLVVDETTVPSYNYDYYFTDFTGVENNEVEMQGKVSGSFGYYGIKAEFNAEASSNSKFEKTKHIVTATMRIERYYSSVKEEKSDLSPDALELLTSKDYVGFFKACGPNYVRGIRRAQEVTAIFSFEAQSNEKARAFASDLQVSGYGSSLDAEFSYDSKYKSMSESLSIKILGFGLGLNEQGSDTLVASSLEEFNNVMKFAFQSMTQSENSAHIGMVYGIEVVPWVDNTSFQVAAKIEDQVLTVPLPRSVIPKAFPKVADENLKFINPSTDENTAAANRDKFKCKAPDYEIDKFGYCCDEGDMENDGKSSDLVPNALEAVKEAEEALEKAEKAEVATDITDAETALKEAKAKVQKVLFSNQICKPTRALDPSIKKNNMASNGEFVALLDSIVRSRLNVLFTLEKCITSVNALPERFDYYILKSQDTVKYDATIEANYTVAELRLALDPLKDYSLVTHMGRELDEFIDMYYSPCLADLFGTNIGSNSETDPMYFMAESWNNHDSCSKLSCLADNMRWDRANGGCIASVISGSTDTAKYMATETTVADVYDKHCSKVITDYGDEECKNDGADLEKFRKNVQHCWTGSARVKSPMYIMDHFCMPQITSAQVSEDVQKEIKTKLGDCSDWTDRTE